MARLLFTGVRYVPRICPCGACLCPSLWRRPPFQAEPTLRLGPSHCDVACFLVHVAVHQMEVSVGLMRWVCSGVCLESFIPPLSLPGP